ncbi:MAG: hypothetical protein IID45_00690 [Planctomycetes bacterium]|nr:hypothetical protein [Planctomycetota bacterium]
MADSTSYAQLEDFESCPMCGHEGITTGGCCANCGERLLEGFDDGELLFETAGLLNWRMTIGCLLFSAFAVLTVIFLVKAQDMVRRERMLHLLIAAALSCVMLIGLTLFVRGILRAVRGVPLDPRR